MDYNRVFKDVATILASNCVNPNTKLPYTNSMLEKALKDTHFSVKPDQPAKLQAFKVLLGNTPRDPPLVPSSCRRKPCVPGWRNLVCQLRKPRDDLLSWTRKQGSLCCRCQLRKAKNFAFYGSRDRKSPERWEKQMLKTLRAESISDLAYGYCFLED